MESDCNALSPPPPLNSSFRRNDDISTSSTSTPFTAVTCSYKSYSSNKTYKSYGHYNSYDVIQRPTEVEPPPLKICNPFRAPTSLPIFTSIKFVKKKGFPVVMALSTATNIQHQFQLVCCQNRGCFRMRVKSTFRRNDATSTSSMSTSVHPATRSNNSYKSYGCNNSHGPYNSYKSYGYSKPQGSLPQSGKCKHPSSTYASQASYITFPFIQHIQLLLLINRAELAN